MERDFARDPRRELIQVQKHIWNESLGLETKARKKVRHSVLKAGICVALIMY